MKKMLLVLSLGLLCASLAFAQDSSAAGQSAAPSTDPSANPGPIQGCLAASGDSYMLTQDGTGTTFKLVGNEDQLKKHVGHEVTVTGQMGSDAGSAASTSGQDQQSSGSGVIQVTNVKMVSKQCSAGGTTPQPR